MQSEPNSFAFLGSWLPSPTRPPGFTENLGSSHDVDAAEPTIQDLSFEETISPPSAPVRPESDSRRTATSDNVGDSIQGAQFTANDDPIQDGIMRALGPSPTRQKISQVRQDLGGHCTYLDGFLAAHKSVDGMQIVPPPRQLPVNKPKTKHRSKTQVSHRCLKCGVEAATKHVFKRHVESKHHPQYSYRCRIESCMATFENPRRDKLLKHFASAHSLRAPSESDIESNRVSHLCPPICTLCFQLVDDWDNFYECFIEHCEVKPAPSKASAHRDNHEHGKKRRRDDPDKGNFDNGADNAGFVSQPGYGQSEKAGGASNPRSSGSGDNQQGRSKQRGGFNQQSSQPQLDLRHLQDQATSQGSMNQCKFCEHAFETCSYCCDSPPSTPWCHACPDAQRALAIQASVHHAGQGQEHLSQPMGVADHAWANREALCDVSSSIPTVVAVNPSLYGAIPQGAQQPNMHRLQHAQAHGLFSGTVTQQRSFASDQSWTDLALHEIEHSIYAFKKKKAQSSNIWSDDLPFRGSKPPARQPLTDVKIAPRVFIGPVSLNKVNFSSLCQCPCRTRSQGAYFARTRVVIAPGRMIEMNFGMAPEARGLGHPLRTRIQVVVKMLGLRYSAAKSVIEKHKQEAHAVLKDALEATLNCSEVKAINGEKSVKVVDLDNIDYESDAESVADSIFSVRSRVSSCNDLTLFSPGPSSPSLKSGGIPSCTGLKLPAPARSSSPLCRESDDDTSEDEQVTKVVEPFEEEEKDLELTFDLDLLSSLDMLSPSGNLPLIYRSRTRIESSSSSGDICSLSFSHWHTRETATLLPAWPKEDPPKHEKTAYSAGYYNLM